MVWPSELEICTVSVVFPPSRRRLLRGDAAVPAAPAPVVALWTPLSLDRDKSRCCCCQPSSPLRCRRAAGGFVQGGSRRCGLARSIAGVFTLVAQVGSYRREPVRRCRAWCCQPLLPFPFGIGLVSISSFCGILGTTKMSSCCHVEGENCFGCLCESLTTGPAVVVDCRSKLRADKWAAGRAKTALGLRIGPSIRACFCKYLGSGRKGPLYLFL
ncbi:hypothetical protein AAHA92_21563 [Salvia divinorum]|uniref:Uncharacterized protein n=1 Tax=Salvia divinorum TaxID=28513 RepID=A0ABD1GLA5_SALDI